VIGRLSIERLVKSVRWTASFRLRPASRRFQPRRRRAALYDGFEWIRAEWIAGHRSGNCVSFVLLFAADYVSNSSNVHLFKLPGTSPLLSASANLPLVWTLSSSLIGMTAFCLDERSVSDLTSMKTTRFHCN